MMPPETRIRWTRTCRLVPSRYPTVGVFDRVASPDDLPELFELEGWTNDRVSAEAGLLHLLPTDEWVTGPMASVVMAAFCHPAPRGARFSDETRGAWYAGRSIETALAESLHRRTEELLEIGVTDTRVEMRLYHADFNATFHDLRESPDQWEDVLAPDSHMAGQELGARLLEAGSNGIVYPSVRQRGGTCLACFRPKEVLNLRVAGHYAYTWRDGRPSSSRL